jgi:hypothetical protein
MKRVQSNIINVGFTIMNPSQEVRDGQGRSKKVKAQGLEINQAVVNGVNAGVTVRTINGGQKSATIKLDTEALEDLLTAVNEVLAVNTESPDFTEEN